jgi:hypothetical protein
MRSVLRGLGMVALGGVAGRALAQPTPPSMVYDAPPSCPAEAEFARRLRARLEASRAAERTQRTLTIHIAQLDGQYVGRLALVEPDGRASAKTLSSRSCDELVNALSLVAALAVQSDDLAVAGNERTDASAPAPSASTDSREAQPPVVPPIEQAPTRIAGGEGRKGAGEASHTSRFIVDLGGLAAAGLAPTVLFGGSLGVQWAVLGEGPWAPAVGVGAVAGAAPSVLTVSGRASFAWYAARLDACLVRLPIGRALLVRGCILGDIGVMNARGSDAIDPRSSSRGWLSLGAGSRLEVPFGPRFGLLVLAGVEAPLRRDRYAFGSADFYEVPVVIATGSLAATAYFR